MLIFLLVLLYALIAALLGRLNASGHEWTVSVGKVTLTGPLAAWFADLFFSRDWNRQIKNYRR